MSRISDTIAAIATPPGDGAIGIVRMSGAESLSIADYVFSGRMRPGEMTSHTLHLGEIRDPQSGAVLDTVLLAVMRAPNSYTGEEMVEIYCHGGAVVLSEILELLLRMGACAADRGEFSKRAFLNGRMDLYEAEAIVDLVKARTREAAHSAALGLAGKGRETLSGLKSAIVESLAMVEASIDFPEDDTLLDRDALEGLLKTARSTLSALLESGSRGRIVREGITAAIVGRPNVGKSSLLNALLGEERAIVAPVPGTTRDYLAEWVDISGVPVRLIDTAGLVESEDSVERQGVMRAKKAIESSDLVLVVLDWSGAMTEEDAQVFREVGDRQKIVVVNKCDLEKRIDTSSLEDWQSVSAKYGDGLRELKRKIGSLLLGGVGSGDGAIFTRARHLAALRRAGSSLESGLKMLDAGSVPEIVAVELSDALSALGEIAGETTPQDILDAIFSEFCIGK
jgi:tRNA modification GTPase